ncbi:tRNA uridine-5-carboxymethylaminomethyl(34) synthesis GTPase MnmE [Sphaerochaeta sp. PS]|uniref:tRNA uridine-5-carboxymethylaminomethyl(34) synthesis GTPase MnmE n=1 Tax=Sphaerochaeta sp. PS TaxID=3076336 RepID=UPI0028A4795C|nr:tRNA uridine-5-carboxymethylaminomethyl(34) synthesis GTPase MnmE [Sphaerochaeta sp. PS]MDT4761916.1 tRNA uridine-5-carboxymethylaminomethyl(34) synthesis GTPase MnmE [Sphaerochaeta sp. PS]
MESYNRDDIIFALATAWAQSALAVIRVSGEGCTKLLSTCFSRPKALMDAQNATLVHGYLTDGPDGAVLDEVVAAVYTQGHGYTAEEAVEFTCHGSLPGLRRILSCFKRLGMRNAEPGEFTFRSFLHGRMDLTQAEAVQELVAAQSERSQAMALSRLEGGLREQINATKEQLLTLLAQVEVQLDYAEDELDEFTFPREALGVLFRSIALLAGTYSVGRLYGQGARIVLAGATNAGKSTLFNLLLKQDRSIVSDIKGTTRDYIEADCLIEGIPIRLYDTAGLRESSDTLESAGIRKTEQLIGQADLVVFLVDSSEVGHIPAKDERTLIVYSKSDLFPAPKGELAISAQSGQGIKGLVTAIANRLTSGFGATGDEQVVIESERQHSLLDSAAKALERALALVDMDVPLDIVAVELGEAMQNLGELTGEVTPADILHKIFSGFCVGK